MKKILCFIALALLVMIPLNVNAAVTKITMTGETAVPSQDGLTKTQKVHVFITSTEKITEVKGTLTFNNATNAFIGVEAVSPWTNMAGISEEKNLSFYNADGVSGEKVALFDFTIKSDIDEKNCNAIFTVGSVTGEFNPGTPATGSSTPYLVIAAGLTLIAVGYVFTKRKTTLHKI